MPRTAFDADPELDALLKQIHEASGFDVREYKPSYLKRRLGIRMRARAAVDYRAYQAVLAHDPGEYAQLLDTITVNLTYFFRDTGAFDALAAKVLTPLVVARAAQGTHHLRLWSAGCATGEETYTLAMACAEVLGAERAHWRIDILGTDVDEHVLTAARAARYNEFSLREVSAERRARYFSVVGPDQYQLAPNLTEHVRFQHLDLLHDPYPHLMDLIVCRNVMIYFSRAHQERMFTQFHQALREDGTLFIGRVETLPPGARRLFSVLDAHEHLYQKLSPTAA